MTSLHVHEPASPIAMAFGVIFAPTIVLAVLFLVAQAFAGI